MQTRRVDVLIVGAGLSGIGAAVRLQQECPKSYAILESREHTGGTWDLFRYPGIRSDSDMQTMSYSFHPWTDEESFGKGAIILEYLRDTAREFGVDNKIQCGHKVRKAAWSSEDQYWTVTVDVNGGKQVQYRANFLLMCTGYYRYQKGYTPDFEGVNDFKGEIIHPQLWSEHTDYTNKRVVVIGSGATAITLVPSLTDKAAHVTMLQRSPTYLATLPARDPIAALFRRILPPGAAQKLTRWKNIMLQTISYHVCRVFPKTTKKIFIWSIRRQLPDGYDVDKHFTPSYNPWDQRVCVDPDGRLFRAIRKGQVSIATDHIDRFTANGIRLRSGKELEADLIVTATGLAIRFLGDCEVSVDGQPLDIAHSMFYKGVMIGNVPNFAALFGYINASWTLKADLAIEYVCRLLKYMDDGGYRSCRPKQDDSMIDGSLFEDFSSGYLQRASKQLPRQGRRGPWHTNQNYLLDILKLRYGRIADKDLEFKH